MLRDIQNISGRVGRAYMVVYMMPWLFTDSTLASMLIYLYYGGGEVMKTHPGLAWRL